MTIKPRYFITLATVATHIVDKFNGSMASNFMPSLNFKLLCTLLVCCKNINHFVINVHLSLDSTVYRQEKNYMSKHFPGSFIIIVVVCEGFMKRHLSIFCEKNRSRVVQIKGFQRSSLERPVEGMYYCTVTW